MMSMEKYLLGVIHDTGIKEWPELTPERIVELDEKGMQFAMPSIWVLRKECDNAKDEAEGEILMGKIAAYLSRFLMPGACPNCGRMTGFRYGIQHGEGSCQCGYPGRACHYITNNEGVEILNVRDYVLWYHPNHLRYGAAKAEEGDSNEGA